MNVSRSNSIQGRYKLLQRADRDLHLISRSAARPCFLTRRAYLCKVRTITDMLICFIELIATPLLHSTGITGGGGGDRRVEFILNGKARQFPTTFYIEVSCNAMFGLGEMEGDAGFSDRYFRLNSADLVAPRMEAWHLLWDFRVLRDVSIKMTTTGKKWNSRADQDASTLSWPKSCQTLLPCNIKLWARPMLSAILSTTMIFLPSASAANLLSTSLGRQDIFFSCYQILT